MQRSILLHTRSSLKAQRGFTLIEVLISMVVLAVVLSAITTMNFSSLTGFSTARDMTEANYVGQKTIALLTTESEQWNLQTASAWSGPSESIYNTPNAYGTTPMLTRILSAQPLTWVDLGETAPFASTGESSNTNVGRFCVAARQVPFPANTPRGLHALRVQVAVYHPGPAQRMVTTCEALRGNSLQNLSAGTYPGETLLSTLGTRVDFYSTILTPPVR